MPVTNLVFIANPNAVLKAIAAWQRVLPEDDIPKIQAVEAIWNKDKVYAVHTERTDYIEALAEIIDETLPANEPRLVSTF